jgi:hypothetical protein
VALLVPDAAFYLLLAKLCRDKAARRLSSAKTLVPRAISWDFHKKGIGAWSVGVPVLPEKIPENSLLRKAACDRVHQSRFRRLWTTCTRLQGKQIQFCSFY